MSDGPKVWAVYDSDNYECGGIHSLHWSLDGAVVEAHKLRASEDEICKLETGKNMDLVGPMKWQWQHRTIEVKEASIAP